MPEETPIKILISLRDSYYEAAQAAQKAIDTIAREDGITLPACRQPWMEEGDSPELFRRLPAADQSTATKE